MNKELFNQYLDLNIEEYRSIYLDEKPPVSFEEYSRYLCILTIQFDYVCGKEPLDFKKLLSCSGLTVETFSKIREIDLDSYDAELQEFQLGKGDCK